MTRAGKEVEESSRCIGAKTPEYIWKNGPEWCPKKYSVRSPLTQKIIISSRTQLGTVAPFVTHWLSSQHPVEN